MTIKIIGLGHDMHGDDQIGLEIVRLWRETRGKNCPGVEAEILESPGVNLLGAIAGLDAAILVAAIRSGAPAGAVQIVNNTALPDFIESGALPRGRGAAEALSLGRLLVPEKLPERLVLVGIEGATFGLGEGLSPAMRAAIPEALEKVDQVVAGITGKGKTPSQVTAWLINVLRKIFSRGPGR